MTWRVLFSLLFLVLASSSTNAQGTSARRWPSYEALGARSETKIVLAKAGLSPDELSAIRSVTMADIRDYCGNDDDKAESVFKSLEVDRVQLSINGPKTIIVEGSSAWEGGTHCMCGATGNCLKWIIDVSGSSGTVLYASFGCGFVVLKTHAHGYFDFVTAYAGHPPGLTMWRFNGARYKEYHCAEDPSESIPVKPCRRK